MMVNVPCWVFFNKSAEQPWFTMFFFSTSMLCALTVYMDDCQKGVILRAVQTFAKFEGELWCGFILGIPQFPWIADGLFENSNWHLRVSDSRMWVPCIINTVHIYIYIWLILNVHIYIYSLYYIYTSWPVMTMLTTSTPWLQAVKYQLEPAEEVLPRNNLLACTQSTSPSFRHTQMEYDIHTYV